MRRVLCYFFVLLILLCSVGCSKPDKLYDKAKADIVKDLPFPKSYKMDYVRKGKMPHITSSGFIAVNSDIVYKIKFQTKDKDGTMVHCYAYVMFDNKRNIVGKQIVPLENPIVDELLGIKNKNK